MRSLVFVILIFALVGCASLPYEKSIAIRKTPKEVNNFDLSSSYSTGKLVIQAFPPSQQFAIKNYAIAIDGQDPLIVSKHSDNYIILNTGRHDLKLYAPSGGIYGEMFGKPSLKEIDLAEGETVVFVYTGPYWAFSTGKLKEKLLE